MAKATIFNAAGDTDEFFYVTGRPRPVFEGDTRLVAKARIADGPHEGEQATLVFVGTRIGTTHAKITKIIQSVDGDQHFALELDHATSPVAILRGTYVEPIRLFGNRHDNHLEGDRMADRLFGNDGNDVLLGRKGRDLLQGEAGRDRLNGGEGSDRLAGGGGADTFIFGDASHSRAGSHRDVIADFAHRTDHIDLTGIDADEGSRGNGSFDFIGRDGFSGEAGELRYANGKLSGDVDGDGSADFQIGLAHNPTLTEADLLL